MRAETSPPPAFALSWGGAALAAGGALLLLLNVTLSPFLPTELPFAQLAGSPLFLWRQSASILTCVLLLFGAVGLHLRQAERSGRLGAAAFGAALLGSALLLAWEWIDVFVLRELALRSPAALGALEDTDGLSLYDLGALIPAVSFALGWLALATATLRARLLPRAAGLLVIAGFLLIPLLSIIVGTKAGGILGSVALGSGLCWLGLAVRRAGGP